MCICSPLSWNGHFCKRRFRTSPKLWNWVGASTPGLIRFIRKTMIRPNSFSTRLLGHSVFTVPYFDVGRAERPLWTCLSHHFCKCFTEWDIVMTTLETTTTTTTTKRFGSVWSNKGWNATLVFRQKIECPYGRKLRNFQNNSREN